MLTLKCPNCGADLKVEDKQEYAVCRYCDSKIPLTDERTPEQIKAEAERIRAENEGKADEQKALLQAQLRIEQEQTRRESIRAMMFIGIIGSLALIALAVIFILKM